MRVLKFAAVVEAVMPARKIQTESVFAVTDLDSYQATQAPLAQIIRGHWRIRKIRVLRA